MQLASSEEGRLSWPATLLMRSAIALHLIDCHNKDIAIP